MESTAAITRIVNLLRGSTPNLTDMQRADLARRILNELAEGVDAIDLTETRELLLLVA